MKTVINCTIAHFQCEANATMVGSVIVMLHRFPKSILDLFHSPHTVKTQAFCQLLCYDLEADSLHFPFLLVQSYITITLCVW